MLTLAKCLTLQPLNDALSQVLLTKIIFYRIHFLAVFLLLLGKGVNKSILDDNKSKNSLSLRVNVIK